MQTIDFREVFIYARQSLDVKDSISIETQLDKGKSLLEAGEIFRTFVDRGYSGKNTKRPGLQNMMREVKEGKAKKIIVYRLDRFSRSLLDFAEMWTMLESNNVEFVSYNEHFDTSTPIGKAMVFIIMIFAQMERETIAERVKDNYYDRVKSGRWPGGPAPWGCTIGRLRIGNQEVPTLQYNDFMDIMEENYYRYFEEKDLSLGRLARELTDRGIPAPGRTAAWNNVTLARLLQNPVWVKADADIYVYFDEKGVNIINELDEFDGVYGCVLVGKREAYSRSRQEYEKTQLSLANWAGRIPSNIWLGVQNRLAQNRKIGNSGKGQYSWLSGVMKCGYCKKALVVGGDRKEAFYCSGSHINPKQCRWSGRLPFTVQEVEKHVAEEIVKVLSQCEDQPMEETETFISNEDKVALVKVEKKIQRLMDVLADEEAAPLTLRYVNDELLKLHEEHKKISERATTQKKKVVRCEQIQFDKLNFEGKKVVTKSYIDKVFVFAEHIEIVWLV